MTPWLWFSIRPVIASASGTSFGLTYNMLVVVTGVAAVGFAAGVVGSLALLRRRPLVGDAAAHAPEVGLHRQQALDRARIVAVHITRHRLGNWDRHVAVGGREFAVRRRPALHARQHRLIGPAVARLERGHGGVNLVEGARHAGKLLLPERQLLLPALPRLAAQRPL